MDKLRKELARAIAKGDAAAITQFRRDHDQLPSLEGETFENVAITGVDLSGLNLSNTEWSSCILERVRFRNVEMEGAYFRSSTFLDTTFEKSRMASMAIDGSIFRGCTFHDLELEEVEWTGADFEQSNFDRVVFEEPELDAVTFNGGSLSAVRVVGGSFNAVTLREVAQEGFELEGTDLSACSGSGQLPPGFKPLSGRRRVVASTGSRR